MSKNNFNNSEKIDNEFADLPDSLDNLSDKDSKELDEILNGPDAPSDLEPIEPDEFDQILNDLEEITADLSETEEISSKETELIEQDPNMAFMTDEQKTKMDNNFAKIENAAIEQINKIKNLDGLTWDQLQGNLHEEFGYIRTGEALAIANIAIEAKQQILKNNIEKFPNMHDLKDQHKELEEQHKEFKKVTDKSADLLAAQKAAEEKENKQPSKKNNKQQRKASDQNKQSLFGKIKSFLVKLNPFKSNKKAKKQGTGQSPNSMYAGFTPEMAKAANEKTAKEAHAEMAKKANAKNTQSLNNGYQSIPAGTQIPADVAESKTVQDAISVKANNAKRPKLERKPAVKNINNTGRSM